MNTLIKKYLSIALGLLCSMNIVDAARRETSRNIRQRAQNITAKEFIELCKNDNNLEEVKSLIQQKPELVNCEECVGITMRTPLTIACSNDSTQIALMLIDKVFVKACEQPDGVPLVFVIPVITKDFVSLAAVSAMVAKLPSPPAFAEPVAVCTEPPSIV